jgi:hypothetical protein
MPVPVAEIKKSQIHTLPSYLTQFPKKKLDDEPPAYSMKHRVIGFLATHKEEAFELEELYQKIFPPENAEFAQRTDLYRKWLCELFDEGNISAGKKNGQICFYYGSRYEGLEKNTLSPTKRSFTTLTAKR